MVNGRIEIYFFGIPFHDLSYFVKICSCCGFIKCAINVANGNLQKYLTLCSDKDYDLISLAYVLIFFMNYLRNSD